MITTPGVPTGSRLSVNVFSVSTMLSSSIAILTQAYREEGEEEGEEEGGEAWEGKKLYLRLAAASYSEPSE